MKNLEKNGFTLVELLVTIGLFIIITGIAGYSFNQYIPGYRLRSATSMVKANLNQARYLSARNNVQYRIFSGSNTSYHIQRQSGATWINEINTDFINDYNWPGITINIDNNNPIFHPNGRIENPTTITLSGSAGSISISMSTLGRIKVER